MSDQNTVKAVPIVDPILDLPIPNPTHRSHHMTGGTHSDPRNPSSVTVYNHLTNL
jgi:hypothetical protein